MRYNIMLQLVVCTTLILVGAAALFAWIQTRPDPVEMNRKPRGLPESIPQISTDSHRLAFV